MQSEDKKLNIPEIRKFLINLQNNICGSIEAEEKKYFESDAWEKKGTGKLDGDGITKIIDEKKQLNPIINKKIHFTLVSK